MYRKFASLTLAAGLASACFIARAEVTGHSADNSISVSIRGVIGEADVMGVTKLIEKLPPPDGRSPWGLFVTLDSVGGNVDAAIAIGRLLRAHNAMAYVPRGGACLSSCVYLLAGANWRQVHGIVGIHRPYDPKSSETTPAAQRQKYREAADKVKRFLAEMNIAPSLYDDSLYVSVEQVKILTHSELSSYGLNRNDPYAEEAREATVATHLGISRGELAKRRAAVLDQCGSIEDVPSSGFAAHNQCVIRVMNGR